MKTIGAGVVVLGYAMFVLLGLAGFVMCMAIIGKAAGFWGFVIAFFLAPVTFAAAPLYAGLAWGDWFPALITYGGSIPGAMMIGVGTWLRERSDKGID